MTINAAKNGSYAGACAGIEIYCGARERAADRIALGEAAREVGQSLADQFLVRIEALPRLGGNRLGHGDRLNESDQRDHQCRRQKACEGIEVKARCGECGQTRRNGADDVAAARKAHALLVHAANAPAPAVALHWARVLDSECGVRACFACAFKAELAQIARAVAIFPFRVVDL
jgi:hypothetical protein